MRTRFLEYFLVLLLWKGISLIASQQFISGWATFIQLCFQVQRGEQRNNSRTLFRSSWIFPIFSEKREKWILLVNAVDMSQDVLKSSKKNLIQMKNCYPEPNNSWKWAVCMDYQLNVFEISAYLAVKPTQADFKGSDVGKNDRYPDEWSGAKWILYLHSKPWVQEKFLRHRKFYRTGEFPLVPNCFERLYTPLHNSYALAVRVKRHFKEPLKGIMHPPTQ